MGDLTQPRTQMPIPTYLFALCRGGAEETWPFPGILVGDPSDLTLSPLGRKRMGSSTLKKIPTTRVGIGFNCCAGIRDVRLLYSNLPRSKMHSDTLPGDSDTSDSMRVPIHPHPERVCLLPQQYPSVDYPDSA